MTDTSRRIEGGSRLGNRRLEGAEITKPGRATGHRDDAFVKDEDFRQR